MKKLSAIFIGMVLVMGISGMAKAETFKLTSYDVSLITSDPGLVLYWDPILTQPTTWNLNVGETTGWFDLLKIGTNEVAVNPDDRVSKPISVSFNWTAPPATVPDTVSGVSYGWAFLFWDGGEVKWSDSPAIFTFGTGGVFKLSLKDGSFGVPGFDVIEAKLSYCSPSETTPVPEPATLLLLGLALIGVIGIRRIRE